MAKPITVSIVGNAGPLKKSLDEADGFLGKFGGSLQKFGVAAAAGIGAAGAGIAVAIGKASDLNETISKVGVIFGETDKQIQDFAKNAASSLGQSRQQALDAAATFGIFGKSAGLSGKALGDFSTEFVGLASDLASFNNTSPEQAINAIGAALRGESEPLRAYGVLLNDATLKTAALELGIYDGNGALTAQQKILAAQKVIFEQTGDAQGDFARTSEGLANSQRILKARLTDTVTEIGTAFLPIAVAAIGALNDGLGPAVKFISERVIPELTRILGKLSDFIKDDVVPVIRDRLLPFIQQTAEFIGEKLVPIIRDVAIKVFEGLRDIFQKVSEKIQQNSGNIEKMKDFFSDLIKFVTTYVAPVLTKVLGKAFDIVSEAIGPVIDVVFKLMGALATLGSFVLKIAGFLVKTFEAAINGVIDVVNFAIRQANRLNPFSDIPEIGNVSISSSFGAAPSAPSRGPAIDVSGVTDSFDRFNAGVNTLPNIPTVTAPTVTTPSGGGGGGGGRGGSSSSTGRSVSSPTYYIQGGQMIDPNALMALEEAYAAKNAVYNYNVTVNTVTTDGEFPTKVVEALQTYNLVSGPLDVQIAI